MQNTSDGFPPDQRFLKLYRQLLLQTDVEKFLDPLGSKFLGSDVVSKDLILICQFHKDSIGNQSCEKYKIPSTILSKLMAHSSTENFVVVVVDRINVAKPK